MNFENDGNRISLTHQTITRKDKGEIPVNCIWCNEHKTVKYVHIVSGIYHMCSDVCLKQCVNHNARKEGY